jgi:hypothetical protein
MTTLDIYRNGVLYQTIKPDANSSQVKQVMGDNVINLGFVLSEAGNFQYGDYCTVFGELYKLNSVPNEKKVASNRYEYNMKMEAEYFDLSKANFLFLGSDNSLKETDFSLTGNALTFINLLLQNANRVSTGWKKGDVGSSVIKTLTFSKENCLTVLQRLAQEFETEWWVEGKTVHLSRRRSVSSQRFRHGKNKGLYNIIRKELPSTKIVTRLYAYGSDKNIPADYRNYAKRLKMTGGVDYLESNTGTYGVVEDTAIFENIYPSRTGTITALGQDIYSFFDSGISFDINQYLLPGVEAKINFLTGDLAGYTFRIKRFLPNSKEIKILPNSEEKAFEVPSDTFKAAVGDQYVLIDISMPQTYITAAEARLQTAASSLLNTLSQPQYSYTVEVDPIYMKRRSRTLSIGMEVTIEDEDLDIDQSIGIVSATRNLQNEYKYTVEISDKKVSGTVASIQAIQTSNSRDIQNIQRAYSTIQDNSIIGDLKIKDGSIIIEDLPPLDGALTNYAAIYINRTTGKLHREA